MSKQLFYGPAAGGKSTFVLELARQRAASLQAEVRVCVPTGLQARAWRAHLAAAGGALGVHVMIFDQLAAACLDEAGEVYTELPEAVQYRVLRRIIGQMHLEHYGPLRTKPGFVQVARQLIGQLKAGLVDPPLFRQAVAELGDEPRLRELADIYEAYQEQLQKQGWADRVGLHWLAVESLETRAPEACSDWPLLVIDGFDDFTSSQLALLKVLAERVETLIITLSKAEKIAYPRYERTQEKVESALGIMGEMLPGRTDSTHPTLQHLAKYLFSLSPSEPLPNDETITLREAADRPAEVRTALRWLKQEIVWGGISPDQVALLAREITSYRPAIQQVAAEFGLPIHLVDGLPLGQNPAIAALMDLLRLFLPYIAGSGPALPRRGLIATWRSPYFSWGEGDLAGSPADADMLDHLAREQRVIRGLAQWREAFAAGMAMEDQDWDDEENLGTLLNSEQVKRLEEKFNYFLAMAQPPAGANSMRDFVRWLERLIGPDPERSDSSAQAPDSLQIIAQARVNPQTAGADVAALRTLKELLRGLVWAEEAAGKAEAANFSTFFNELSGGIAATRFFPPVRNGENAILVADVTQVRGLSFEAVAVMGLSEGSFPATISEDPFLRDEDREKLREQFQFPLPPSTQSAEQEFFYEAVTRPRGKLLLTRPILAENGAEWVASPFWEAVRQLTSRTPEQIPSEGLLTADETASWAEWWETIAANSDVKEWADGEDARTWQQIVRAAGIWQERQGAKPSIWEGDLRSASAVLAEEHGPERVWSASRLETYQKCGFLFYVRYVLGLEPRQEPAEGLDARQLGSLYHRIFERVTRAKGLDWGDEAQVQSKVAEIATPILDAAPEEEGFRETPWWVQTRQEIINNVTRSVVALAGNGYEFDHAERSFGISSKPLILEDGEDRVQLRGFIDRIDRREDGRIRIIDYKLGGPYSFAPRAFAEGKKLQLPLYALAAEVALALGEVADGFYWHFRQVEKSPFQLAKAEGGVNGAMETAVAHTWDVVRRVRRGEFKPQPPAEGCPPYCPAAGFCWHYTPKSW